MRALALAIALLPWPALAQQVQAPVAFEIDVDVVNGRDIDRKLDTLKFDSKDWVAHWRDRLGRGSKPVLMVRRDLSVRGDPRTTMAGLEPIVVNDKTSPVLESVTATDPNALQPIKTSIYEDVPMPGNFDQGGVDSTRPQLTLGVLTEGFTFKLGKLEQDGIEYLGTVTGVTEWRTKFDRRLGVLLLASQKFEGVGGMRIRLIDNAGVTQEINSPCRITIKVGAEKVAE